MRSHFKVRPVRESDWPAIRDIEERWRAENVEPLSEATFALWLRTHPEGFLLAEDAGGQIWAHAYGEYLAFDLGRLGRADADYGIFTRPYHQPGHNPAG